MAIHESIVLGPRRPVTAPSARFLCVVIMLVALAGCGTGNPGDGSKDPGGSARSSQGASGDKPSSGGGSTNGGSEHGTTGGDWRGGGSGRDWQPTGGTSGAGGKTWNGDQGRGDKERGGSSKSTDREKQQDIAWLPWGPKSPTTETTTDVRHAYDLLQAGQCQQALDLVDQWGGRHLSWSVIEGLAGACLAVHGRRDGWGIAIAAEERLSKAGYQPDVGWCKEGDAYAVLKRLTAFHRQYPRVRVRLVDSPSGVMACDSGITGVSYAGGGHQVRPGERVTVVGTWPSKPTGVTLSWSGSRPTTITGNWSTGSACCERAQLWFPFPDELDGRPAAVLLEVVGDGFTLSYRQQLVVDWSSPTP
ncbi:hypothetical protein [Streptomyces levis]